jgi:hypothetical protein
MLQVMADMACDVAKPLQNLTRFHTDNVKRIISTPDIISHNLNSRSFSK